MVEKKVNVSFCEETRKNLKEDSKRNYDAIMKVNDNHLPHIRADINSLDKKVSGLTIKLGLLISVLYFVLPIVLRLVGL